MFIWLETSIRNWNSHPFVVWLQSIASDNEQTSKAQSIQKSPNSKQKTAVIDNDRPKRLSAAVVKIHMKLWYIDSDNENDTDSSYDFSDFGSQSDSSDSDIY